MAAGSLAILLGWPKVSRRVPAPIVAILLGSVLVAVLGLPVETIGTRFGEIRASIPTPRLPAVTLERIRELFSPAVTVALLAGIESLLSAVVADGMIGSRHKSNVELVAQGVANVASGLFGGMPATGAIARTATNVKAGGRTPVAGMTHAAVVAAAFLFLGKWARYIPLATLAAILVVVAYHMSEWRAFAQLFRTPKSDVAVLLTTFLLTVLIDLTVAVQVGVVLAAFLFIKRMADVTNVGMVTEEWKDVPDGTMRGDAEGVARRAIPAGVEVYEVNGPFFFGAADKIKDVLHFVAKKPKVFILRMRNVPVIDASGIRVLDDLFRSFSHQDIRFLISGIRAQPLEALERAGKLDEYGRENFVATIDEALEVATRHVAASAGRRSELHEGRRPRESGFRRRPSTRSCSRPGFSSAVAGPRRSGRATCGRCGWRGALLFAVGRGTRDLGGRDVPGRGTSPNPMAPTTALAMGGPYRFTRNPMYLGMSILSAGFAVFWNALWPLLTVPVAMVLVNVLVIAKEEAYLARLFGGNYLG